MKCNRMIFGRMQRNCITYRENDKEFTLYQRKYENSLRVCVDNSNYEGAKGIEILRKSQLLVQTKDKVQILCSQTYKQQGEINISLKITNTREPIEIIGFQKSTDEDYIAIISGKNLVMEEQEIMELLIYKVSDNNYSIHKIINLEGSAIFENVSMDFSFDKNSKCKLIFANKLQIFTFDYEREISESVYIYSEAFVNQPSSFVSDTDQRIFVISSYHDSLWVDLDQNIDCDLDETFDVGAIVKVIYDQEDQKFYFLANIRNGILGYYLI